MVAIASDLSNDFIIIALACWWPHFLVALGSTRDLLLSAKHLFVAASLLYFLKLNARSIAMSRPGSLATPLSRSDPVLRFVRSRQRSVRRSQAPRDGGRALGSDLFQFNSATACTRPR